MLVSNLTEPSADVAGRCRPRNLFPSAVTLAQGMEQPIRVVLIVEDAHPLDAGVAPSDWMGRVRPHRDDAIAFDVDFKTTERLARPDLARGSDRLHRIGRPAQS